MTPRRRALTRLATVTLAAGLAVSAGVAGAASSPPSEPDGDTVTPSEPAASAADASAPTTTIAPTTTTVAQPTTTAPQPTTTASTVPPTTVPAITYPLTGVAVADPGAYVPRPALIVKIDNVEAQPQAGLNQADIVFEEIVEGRATRFAAVFNSMDSDPVGPIRSGRTQDVALLSSFNDPIFAYSGANAGVNAALDATGWTLLTQGNGMFRDSTYHGSPHNLFGNTTEFFAQAGDAGDAVPQFQYGPPAGTPVTAVNVGIGGYTVDWQWDPTAGLFLRTQNGGTHDTTTGQASTNTVIVLLVPYGTSPVASGSPEAQTIGAGTVVVYSNGLKVEGTWTRSDPSQPFTLEAGGAPILLTPGRTWVELVDADNYTLADDAAG
jgi:hypothetical protein